MVILGLNSELLFVFINSEPDGLSRYSCFIFWFPVAAIMEKIQMFLSPGHWNKSLGAE